MDTCCVWDCCTGAGALCPGWWGHCLYYMVTLGSCLSPSMGQPLLAAACQWGVAAAHPLASRSPDQMWRNHSQCGTVPLTGSQELSCIGCGVNLHLRGGSPTTIIFLGFSFRKPVFHPVLWTSWSVVTWSDWKSILSFLCWWFKGTHCRRSFENVGKCLGGVWRWP